ncbi:adenylate/guanylate cyclase domain-containing protein [Pseudodesulfovibrio senegalensis]|uniref:HAMP domain-containing protein n=1 Tax=Pseudodesulfovibrio senegalensis TaxID=1721087 RepID=A0A6N6N218_9BACT|nr:adenylate/guanylate cyclase domain-containing protein [Pseudodesulfovibrio senegalensis]KAB1441455.1 HAMP domain-containing protein [Pseudodesulfovibrio senegalensis]
MSSSRKTVIIPLYINILTIFFLLITSAVGVVVLYNQHMNAQSALKSADQFMNRVGTTILERTQAVFGPALMAADTFSRATDIGEKPNLLTHPLAPMFFSTLEQNPGLTSIYIGFADGDFFLISSLKDRPDARTAIGAPAKAMWYTRAIFHRADGFRYSLTKYLDKGFALMGSSVEKQPAYDPSKRPWYTLARGSAQPMLSDIYMYSFSREPGISVARRFDAEVPGVVALDISLAKLADFMDSQRVGKLGELTIFEPNGQVFVHPDTKAMLISKTKNGNTSIVPATVPELGSPVLEKLYMAFLSREAGSSTALPLTVNNVHYMGSVRALPESLGKPIYLAMAVPTREFTGPITAAGRKSMIASLIILALYIPLIIWVSRRITKPLNALMGHVDDVRHFRLDKPIAVRTHISELHRLGKAMETMRTTLRSFGRYIPRKLVKNMITLGIHPTLGGERRELTIFFSDIKDFTPMAETMAPEELTTTISEYFQKLGSRISNGGGTIDKYMGDAIMAFWNAPAHQPDHAERACLTALRCRRAAQRLNQQRAANGLPPLTTRFGLHTDEAVVGNVGSSDRMNFTVMGAAVNLASRLEGLNKYYGTTILVSETTARKAGDRFLFRTAGKVLPKGVSQPVAIAELAGLQPGHEANTDMHDDLLADTRKRQTAGQWESALDLFNRWKFKEAEQRICAVLQKNPDDGLAAVYCDLARQYMESPPAPDWNGILKFSDK